MLILELQPKLLELVAQCERAGYPIIITETFRSFERQAAPSSHGSPHRCPPVSSPAPCWPSSSTPRAYERLDGRWRLVDLPGELYERAKELCR